MEHATQGMTGTESELQGHLRHVSFFGSLDTAALLQLASCARRRRFGPNKPLFHQGDPGMTLYLVLSGRVRIERVTESGQTVHLAHRGPGECFGEMALFDGKPRMADAITTGASELLMLDRDAFVSCIKGSPEIALAVMSALAERLREAADHLESHRELDVPGRVAEALLDMMTAHGIPQSGGGIRIGMRVTHQELADQIGATRETVTRALSALRRAKTIRSEGRDLIILSPDRLRQRSAR